jgi:hypothetical protein
VGAAYRPASQLDRPGGDPVGVEYVEAYRRPYHVDDRVQSAHFVKGNFAGSNAVNLGFGFGNAGKDRQSAFLRARAQGGFFDQRLYVAPRTVRVSAVSLRRIMSVIIIIIIVMVLMIGIIMIMMVVVVVMTTVAAVLITITIIIIIIIIIIVGNVIRFAFQFHGGAETAKTAALILNKIQFPAGYIELGKF